MIMIEGRVGRAANKRMVYIVIKEVFAQYIYFIVSKRKELWCFAILLHHSL